QHGGDPESKTVHRQIADEIGDGEQQNRARGQSVPDGSSWRGRWSLFPEPILNPMTLRRSKPGCLVWPIGQKEIRNCAEQNGRYSFQYEEPTPTCKTKPGMAQNPAGYRRADHKRQRNRRHEVARGLGAVLANEPVA